jgi:hypothetical protein
VKRKSYLEIINEYKVPEDPILNKDINLCKVDEKEENSKTARQNTTN